MSVFSGVQSMSELAVFYDTLDDKESHLVWGGGGGGGGGVIRMGLFSKCHEKSCPRISGFFVSKCSVRNRTSSYLSHFYRSRCPRVALCQGLRDVNGGATGTENTCAS